MNRRMWVVGIKIDRNRRLTAPSFRLVYRDWRHALLPSYPSVCSELGSSFRCHLTRTMWMLCFAYRLAEMLLLLSLIRSREPDIEDAANSLNGACIVTTQRLVGACWKEWTESLAQNQFKIEEIINQSVLASYFALVFRLVYDCSSLTVFTVGWAIETVERTPAVALLDLRLSFTVVLLLFKLSKSLNFGMIPPAGRTTFCRNPKRLPRAFAGCAWSRFGGCKRGVAERPVVAISLSLLL